MLSELKWVSQWRSFVITASDDATDRQLNGFVWKIISKAVCFFCCKTLVSGRETEISKKNCSSSHLDASNATSLKPTKKELFEITSPTFYGQCCCVAFKFTLISVFNSVTPVPLSGRFMHCWWLPSDFALRSLSCFRTIDSAAAVRVLLLFLICGWWFSFQWHRCTYLWRRHYLGFRRRMLSQQCQWRLVLVWLPLSHSSRCSINFTTQ